MPTISKQTKATIAKPVAAVVKCDKCGRDFWDLKNVPGGTLAGTEHGGSNSSVFGRRYCTGTFEKA